MNLKRSHWLETHTPNKHLFREKSVLYRDSEVCRVSTRVRVDKHGA